MEPPARREVICLTKLKAISTRGEADRLPSVSTILYNNSRVHITTEAHIVHPKETTKSEISVICIYIYGCVRTELRHSNRNRETGDPLWEKSERKQCAYGLCDWPKIGQKQLKARQSRQILMYLVSLKLKTGIYSCDVRLANGRVHGVCFVHVFSV